MYRFISPLQNSVQGLYMSYVVNLIRKIGVLILYLCAACCVLNACHVLRAGALSVARTLETDDVIDPAESRSWIAAALEASAEGRATGRPWGGGGGEDGRKRPCVSPW